MATHTSESGASAPLQFIFEGTGADPSIITPPAPSPEPTPEPSTPVNPATPDTGFFTGSSSLDAAPFFIGIIVLAIGIITAIIVSKTRPRVHHNYLSLSSAGLKIRDIKTIIKNLGIFTSILAGTFLSASIIAPNFLSETKSTSALSGTALSISRASTGTLAGRDNFDTNADITIALSDTITINAQGSTYKVYLTTNDDNATTGNYLKRSDEISNIGPVKGTITAPSALNVNEWGFTSVAPTVSPSSIDTTKSIWAAVPIYTDNETQPAVIPSSTIVSNKTRIIYAARGEKSATAAGTYTTTVLYTAVADI